MAFHETERHSSRKKRKKEIVLTEDERILLENRQNHELVTAERQRVYEFKRKQYAARIIQRAWKYFVFRHSGVMKTAAESIKSKRLKAGEDEWKMQIAALTIQLSWRKYYRRKLLNQLTPDKKHLLHMYDADMLVVKQRELTEAIYTEEIDAIFWHPELKRPVRPTWLQYMPSSAALSFNFAVDQYQPDHAGLSQYYEFGMEEEFKKMKLDTQNPNQYSYNMAGH